MEVPNSTSILLLNRYRLQHPIGEGGSGITYAAINLENNQPVALKVLSLDRMTDWKQLELFEREASILSQLNHPGIPRYLDYFHIDTPETRNFYIAQQLVEGKSLFELVNSGWRPTEKEVRGIAVQILEILIYLHQLKPPVIHRDIKPQNIILRSPLAPLTKGGSPAPLTKESSLAPLTKESSLAPLTKGGWGDAPLNQGGWGDAPLNQEGWGDAPLIKGGWGDLFLVDFGSVQNTYHSTFARGSTVVGTFGYMAPEQFIGQAVPATDLYGLGATLLFLLTHRSPADLPTDRLKIDFRSRVQISEEFADWLEKMLEPDVKARFQSAKTALAMLRGQEILKAKPDVYTRWKSLCRMGVAAVATLTVLNYFKYPILGFLGLTPLEVFDAAKRGEVETVKRYLEQGFDVNTKTIYPDCFYGSCWYYSVSLLHLAADNSNSKLAELLIAKGADVNINNHWDRTPLPEIESLEVARLLIANGVDVKAKDRYGNTPLHYARLLEVAKLLIAKGADVNAKNNYGSTPLYGAGSSPEVAKLLIANGADVNAKNPRDFTPLHEARSLKVAKLLIAKGADVNAKNNSGQTPLEGAGSLPEVAKLLIANGADVNAKNPRDFTPLHEARSLKVAKLLIAKGADVNAKTKLGTTPLYKALQNYNYVEKGVVELLIAKGADVNAKNNWGVTPLHYAVLNYSPYSLNYRRYQQNLKSPYLDGIKLLLAKGANVNAKDNKGNTPLHKAL